MANNSPGSTTSIRSVQEFSLGSVYFCNVVVRFGKILQYLILASKNGWLEVQWSRDFFSENVTKHLLI